MERENVFRVNESPMLVQKLAINHAKNLLGGFIIGLLIIYIFSVIIPNVLEYFYPQSYWDYILEKQQIHLDKEVMASLPQITIVGLFYTFVFSGVIEIGKALYILTFIRSRKVDYSAFFEGAKLFFKGLCLAAARSLFITFGLMLFIIPGVIAFYSFRQAYFILADNPRKGVMQCLAESKIRMYGNKMSLFRLDLSYISLIMVAYIPMLILNIFNLVKVDSLSGLLIILVANIPVVIAQGWLVVGQGIFYELQITGGFDKFKYAGEEAFREGAVIYKNPQSFN